jgi:pyrroloquinoline quinone biosynthesis protein D
VRGRVVLLAPERVLMPDAISVAILESCDGRAPVSEISRALSEQFEAGVEQIQDDVITLLQDLADRGYVSA